MADTVASAWVEVVPDFRDFRKTANKQLSGILGGAGDEAGKVGAAKAGTAFTSGIPAWGKGLIGAVAGLKIGQMLADVLVDSVSLASNLGESKNAIKVAYGSMSKDIAKLGAGSAKRLGLSELDFNAIATQFSAFANTIEKDSPAKFIDKLSRRGADFASVFNLEVADALSLFQSGLSGEAEPLRKYGIDLSDASVQAYAFANGIAAAEVDQRKVTLAQNALNRATEEYSEKVLKYGDSSTEASAAGDAATRAQIALEDALSGSNVQLTEAQKQQARYGLLMQQTDQVQGDFRNTSGELANSQRIFQASLDDTKAKLGQSLLPALKEVVSYGNTVFLPFLDQMVGKLTTQVGPDLGAFISEQDPEKNQVRIDAFVADLGRRLGLGAEQIGTYFTNAWNNANVVMGAKLQLGLTQIGDMFEASASLWGGRLQNGSRQIGDFFTGLGVNITRWAAGVVSSAFNAGTSIVRGIADGIGSAIGDVNNAMADVMRVIASFLPHSPAQQGPFSGSGWAAVHSSGAALMGQFTAGMGTASFDGVSSSLEALVPLTPAVSPRSFSTADIAPQAATGSGKGITQNIYPTPGMSEETVGRVAADSLAFEMRGA